MNIRDNKQLVSEFFDRFSRGDRTGVLELMAEDVTWRIPGKPGTANRSMDGRGKARTA